MNIYYQQNILYCTTSIVVIITIIKLVFSRSQNS